MLTSSELQIAVVEELINLRRGGISQLDVLNSSGQPEMSLPLLERAALRFLDGSSGLTRSEAIAKLLRSKIELLPSPEHRLWLPVSLGVKEELPTTDPKELNKIAADMARHSSPDDFKRTGGKLQRAFQVLAAQIVNDCLIVREVGESSSRVVSSTTISRSDRRSVEAAYISRPALECQLHELYAQGHKLIVLVGQAGMGKTSLAREVAWQLVNADVPLIQITEKGIHTPDLAVALRRYQIRYEPTSQPVERLAALLCDEHSPQLVILDNLSSADELRSLLPSQLRATVLATARIKGSAPPESAVFVPVGKMAQPEAEALVRHHAPNLDAATVERLARELHGYPLVLRHAGALLEHGGLTVGDLAQSLRSTSATVNTVGRMPTEDGARLAIVLNRVIALLREEDALACELLRMVAFVRHYASVSHQFLYAYAEEIEQRCTRLRARQAVQTLADFSLVAQTERDVRIHPLTRTLLASMFAEQYGQVYTLALKVRAKQKERCTANEAKYRMPRVNPFELMDNGIYAYHEIDARWEGRYWAEREQRNEPPEPHEVPDWARVWNAVASRKVFNEIREQAGLPPLD